jgi:DNA adenine methylase
VTVATEKRTGKARPFLKWAGGKTQLLGEIGQRLPGGLTTGQIDTYVEPFVGGGAVFFYVAQQQPKIKRFYLYDINDDLVRCYNAIKGNVDAVVAELQVLERAFFGKRTSDSRRKLYLSVRKEFNLEKVSHFGFATAAKLIFLNKTCYNGLYRVNKKGEFNVPFGNYVNPRICDASNLRNVSAVLHKAEVICDDFEASQSHITKRSFVYFDPPYRPLSGTARFTSYSKQSFLEGDQTRLATFCRKINAKGARFLLSNSDPRNENPNDRFFERTYKGFRIKRVRATRPINCKGSSRGQISELLIANYADGRTPPPQA